MTATNVLWGGPEDGKEIRVRPDAREYVLDTPSDRAPERIVGVTGMLGNVEVRKARYIWNIETKRFEWGEYL
jgi:hypothetical protein